MPPGQTIDIPYLKTLDTRQLVPIAYCPKGDIDQVTNFVPGCLARVTRRLWELYDKEDYIIDKICWDEGPNTLLDRFGISIQHPEDRFVQYFGGTTPTLIKKGSPRCSIRKNPPETNNTDGRGLSSLASPGRGGADLPGQGGAKEDNYRGQEDQGGVDENAAGQRKGEEEMGQGGVCTPVAINEKASPCCSTRKNPSETDHEKGRGLSSIEFPRRGGADLPGQGASDKDEDKGREVQGGVDKTAGEQQEGEDKKGQEGVSVVVGGSGDQDRTEDTIQESSKAQKSKIQNKSRKVISRQLPLKSISILQFITTQHLRRIQDTSVLKIFQVILTC